MVYIRLYAKSKNVFREFHFDKYSRMTKRLFLLQVAINDYPGTISPLHGCVNDLTFFNDFIHQHYASAFEIVEKKICNREATKNNIIDGFRLFEAAGSGDTCLFFYAGHGAQISVPQAFKHLEPNGKLEAVVPYDALQDEGGPLLDKEISHLIHQVIGDKQIHFTAIMDCCHSGSITRMDEANDVHIRTVRDTPLSLQKVHGIEEFREEKGRLTPRSAPHILLSASKSSETAKEIWADGQKQGVFTYALINTLKNSGRQLSYQQLINRTNLLVARLIPEQSPQLEQRFTDNAGNKFFLTDTVDAGKSRYVLFQEKATDQWAVKLGATGGIRLGDEHEQTTFQLTDPPHSILTVTEVLPDRCYVSGVPTDFRGQYTVFLHQVATSKIKLAFDKSISEADEAQLRQSFTAMRPTFMELSERDGAFDFLLRADADHYWLSLPFSIQGLFQSVPKAEDPDGTSFLNAVEKVARWNQILYWNNPSSQLRHSDFEVSFYLTTQPGKYEEDSPARQAMDLNQPIFIPFLYNEGRWYDPAFKLKIKNNYGQKLWFSLVYMESNYGISNELLPAIELDTDEEAWAEYQYDRTMDKVIRLWVEDELYEKGTLSLHDHLKIFVSTEDPHTSELYQKGLAPDKIRIHRGFGRRPRRVKDWITQEIPLHIHRPVEEQRARASQAAKLQSVQVEAPDTFEAKIGLTEANVAILPLREESDLMIDNKEKFQPFEVRPALYYAEGVSVITLREIANKNDINKDTPLVIRFDGNGRQPAAGAVVPVSMSIDGSMKELPHKSYDNEIHIYDIPEQTPEAIPGIEQSSKIFLHHRAALV